MIFNVGMLPGYDVYSALLFFSTLRFSQGEITMLVSFKSCTSRHTG